ncbi:MAG: cysteine synthase A [Bacilli bacterium]|nr:cysteine synthase A [Bacilli bacterium]
MKVAKHIYELVGHTPLLELSNIEKEYKLYGKVIAKVESFNPGGSAKDRPALKMIEYAEEKGFIDKGTAIIEPTSGNTGIGLAMIAASKGYRVILTMPESMSLERRNLLKAYGAEIVLTPASLGMKGAIAKADELLEHIPNSFMPSQFTNKNNPLAHYLTTGREIYEDMDEKVDIFIASVGTGGTISGVGKYLKEQNPNIKVIAVEPLGSPMLSEGKAGPHKIQGIGAGFVPDTLDTSIYDEIIRIKDEDAFEMGRLSARKEGLLVGISSGAALKAAIEVASREENKDKNIIVLLPDTGERYLSTDMFK